MADLLYNNDSDNIFSYHRHDMSLEVLEGRLDITAEAGSSIFIQDVGAQRVNYDSKVWQSWLSGFDPAAGADQPFFDGQEPEAKGPNFEQRMAMVKLKELGIDFLGHMLKGSRKRGMAAWVAMRLNDHHGTTGAYGPINSTVSSFWAEHPQCRRHPDRTQARTFQTLDFNMEIVRQRYLSLIDELLERYDFDGFEMDGLRTPFCFRIGREYEGRPIMTQFVRDVRSKLDAAAVKRGHPIAFAVRVPSQPTTAMYYGFEVGRWARERLIDWVVLSSGAYGGEMDYATPIDLWKDLLDPHDVKLATCLLPSETRYPGARGTGINGMQTAAPDGALGAAVAAIHAGADGIELFNYFPEKILDNGRGWTEDLFKSTLKAMRSLNAMLPLQRKHMVTCRQMTAPGELIGRNALLPQTGNWTGEMCNGEYPLPAEGTWLAFRLLTGSRPTGRKVQVVIGTEDGRPGAGPQVRVNDVKCHVASEDDMLCTYDVPEDGLADGEHVIEVMTDEGSPVRVTRVELIVAAA